MKVEAGSVHQEVFFKQGVLKSFTQKKSFSCKICEIFKNVYFCGTPPEAASVKGQVSEAVSQRFSAKNVFLEISQNSQENICARVSFLIKLQA